MVHLRRRSPLAASAVALGAIFAGALEAQSPDPSFDALYAQLRIGRAYSAEAPTGRIERTREGPDGRTYRYVLVVPDDYDPSRRYPVAFYLHGGVSRPDPGPRRRLVAQLRRPSWATIASPSFPLSTAGAFWWERNQADNLRAILAEVKSGYNVDENRVYVFGDIPTGGRARTFRRSGDVTPLGRLPSVHRTSGCPHEPAERNRWPDASGQPHKQAVVHRER